MKRHLAMAGAVWTIAVGCLLAQGPKGLQVTPEEFEAKLGYQTGTVTLKDGIATIRLPESFRFIGADASRRLITEAWANPPDSADGVLGMLIPGGVSPLTAEGWGVIITYEEEGYVNDSDAASIDYTKMLKEMQDATVAANAERKKQGFEPVTLVGWAEPPSYNAETHKLYWAKELAFASNTEHTLNYNIRILGRRGVLVLNAVAGMDQLRTIHSKSPEVLAAVEFNEGHRYTDFLPGKDKAATYGITGLIVGAAAAKAGLFKMLWVGILAFKKLIIVGLIGLGAAIKRFFRRETTIDPPQPTQG
jgi:uncharacterized membrane-anchored protein